MKGLHALRVVGKGDRVHQTVKTLPAAGQLLPQPIDFGLPLHVANVDLRRRHQFADAFPQGLGLYHVETVRPRLAQQPAHVPSHTLAIGHTEDQDPFSGKLKKIHVRMGDLGGMELCDSANLLLSLLARGRQETERD